MMNGIVEELKLNVLNYFYHDFTPHGCSMIYLLQESHLTIHTYPQYNSYSLDLYTCSLETDLLGVCDIIYDFFDEKCKIKYRILDR